MSKDSQENKGTRMQRNIILALGIIAVVIAGLSFVATKPTGSGYESTPQAQEENPFG